LDFDLGSLGAVLATCDSSLARQWTNQ